MPTHHSSGRNGARRGYGRDTAIRCGIAKTAVVLLIALAGCGDGQYSGAGADAAAKAAPERWMDPHGNVCESLRPGLARCRTPDGHIWYREDAPTPGSLVRDPVKAMMWLFSRGRGDVSGGSGPNPHDTGSATGD